MSTEPGAAQIAPRDKTFRLADGKVWRRRKGDILVPSSYDKKDIENAKKLTSPDHFWFHQQGVGQNLEAPFRHLDFGFVSDPIAVGPPVISIDPGQREGPSNSYTVIQVWQKTQTGHHLADQFREQCTFTAFEDAATFLIKRWRPAAVLVENAAHGGALLARMKEKFKKVRFVAIEPRDSKKERLNRHRNAIRKGIISVQSGDWALDFIKEFVDFPMGYTDQIDATTQYLDFMATNPILKSPPTPGLFASSRQITTIYKSPNIASARGSVWKKLRK